MDYLTVAKIVKPQGIRGELKVITYTDSPDVLSAFKRVYIEGNEYKLLKARPQSGDCAFITLSQIADRNAAELLRGKEVEVAKSDVPALPEGTYYIADIIGCEAYDDGGKYIGKVTDVTPAKTDVYEVQKEDGKKLVFPAVEGLILSVDLVAKKIILNRKRLSEVALEEK